mmetsp:Transcript_56874/g.151835  ORF Transcript_56874/g.151835 Transcript_56874/m.151835 type:complete len:310 (+) Transcript_56874:190-1119(+)
MPILDKDGLQCRPHCRFKSRQALTGVAAKHGLHARAAHGFKLGARRSPSRWRLVRAGELFGEIGYPGQDLAHTVLRVHLRCLPMKDPSQPRVVASLDVLRTPEQQDPCNILRTRRVSLLPVVQDTVWFRNDLLQHHGGTGLLQRVRGPEEKRYAQHSGLGTGLDDYFFPVQLRLAVSIHWARLRILRVRSRLPIKDVVRRHIDQKRTTRTAELSQRGSGADIQLCNFRCVAFHSVRSTLSGTVNHDVRFELLELGFHCGWLGEVTLHQPGAGPREAQTAHHPSRVAGERGNDLAAKQASGAGDQDFAHC